MADESTPKVDAAGLEALIARAGVSPEVADALRGVNATTNVPVAAGHGAAGEDQTDFGVL
jgi:hypothetical protein